MADGIVVEALHGAWQCIPGADAPYDAAMATGESSGGALLRDALQALSERRFDDAIALARRALDAQLDENVPPDERGIVYDRPERSRAHYVVGSALQEKGEPRAAIAELDRALRFDPEDKVSFSNRAVARRDLGDGPGALEDFGRALARDPRYAHARANRARLHAARGELELADADYKQLWTVAPTPEHRREWDAVRERLAQQGPR
jgi:tetratricopeptide (TPR) repeat protein